MGSSFVKTMNVVLLIDRSTRPFDVTSLHFLDAPGLNLDTRHHFRCFLSFRHISLAFFAVRVDGGAGAWVVPLQKQ